MKILKSTTSLALALIMSVIFGITSFAANLCTVYVKGAIDYGKAFECLNILNSERRNAGLNELTMDTSLIEVAVTRAFECNLFFSHDRPNGTSCETLQDTSTYYGENVASGYKTAAQVMDGWMNSPEHKANMLSDKYNSVGIACVNGVWVQEFSGRCSQQASKPANCTVVRGISCDASNMYMESPYRYKPANLSVGDKIELLAPKLHLFNQLCYGVDISSYDITTSDSSIATVNGLTLTAHKGGDFSVIYTLKGTNISSSVEFSVEGTVEEEKPSQPKNIYECTFTLSKSEYTYSGKECKPTVTVMDGSKTLSNGIDFTVRYENNVDAGCAKVYVKGKGEYIGTKELFSDIYMKNILDGAELEYYECKADGTPKKPKLITNTNAIEAIDYTITYSNNVEPGIGIAYIEATNINYYGWGELYFNINEAMNADENQGSSENDTSENAKAKNISECSFTLNKTEYTYCGKECKPTVTVKDGSKTLVKGADFTVRYENNIDAGCAKAYVKGMGKYTGTEELFFDIYTKNILDGAELEFYTCEFDGTAKKPKLITSTTAVEGVDYTVKYSNNVEPGIGIVCVEATNVNFYGWGELYFNIDMSENGDANQVTEDNGTAVTEETTDIPEAKKTQTISVPKNAKLTYGKTLELFASAKTAISYKSLDTSVAKINSKGIITATGAGTTKILITAAETDEYEKTTAYVNVTVEKAAQKITVKDSFVKYADSPSFNLGAESKTKLSYKSTNTNIVAVSSNGTVTIKGSGTVSIKITAAESANYKSVSKTVLINVYKNSDNDINTSDSYDVSEDNNTTVKDKSDAEVIIELDKTSQSISVTKTTYSKTTDSKPFYLNTKAKTKLTYKTSNSKVVTVTNNGKVTIKGIGKATITITAVETDNYEKAVKKVTVTVKPTKPSVKSLSSKNDRLIIRWDKLDDNITGYQIAYKRVGSESYKCKTYKGSSLTKKIFKGFSDGTYYVKMRAYKLVNEKRIYSSWSTVKKINISF